MIHGLLASMLAKNRDDMEDGGVEEIGILIDHIQLHVKRAVNLRYTEILVINSLPRPEHCVSFYNFAT